MFPLIDSTHCGGWRSYYSDPHWHGSWKLKIIYFKWRFPKSTTWTHMVVTNSSTKWVTRWCFPHLTDAMNIVRKVFFPKWDGPYTVTATHPETSSYTIDLPPGHNDFSNYYASELKLHIPKDVMLSPHANMLDLGLYSPQMECKNMRLNEQLAATATWSVATSLCQ